MAGHGGAEALPFRGHANTESCGKFLLDTRHGFVLPKTSASNSAGILADVLEIAFEDSRQICRAAWRRRYVSLTSI